MTMPDPDRPIPLPQAPSVRFAAETPRGGRVGLSGLFGDPEGGLAMPGPKGAYVHVPFCRHKCHYCDFYSFVDTQDRQEAFVERLDRELAEVATMLPAGTPPIETVFIGGGTPTMLRPTLLRRLLDSIRRHLPLEADERLEWTVEANPETVDREIADTLAAGGVNRASLGAQSFTPRLLAALERDHRIESVAAATAHLRDAGISNLNLDLIFAVPGSTLADWSHDLDEALALAPTHISAYGLTYEPNTPLAKRESRGEIEAVDDGLEAEMYEHSCERLGAAGFERYEISNWSRPGQACRHNLVYWRNESWLAFGPSASGHLGGLRYKIVPRLGEWLEDPRACPLSEWERLEASGTFGEALMLGLRLVEGLDAAWLEEGIARHDGDGVRRAAIEAALADGRLEAVGGRVRLTPRGTLLADTLLSELV